MHIKVKKLHVDAIIPQYQTAGASGFDLHSTSDVYIDGYAIIDTGLAFEIPEGYEMQIRPRSGLAFKHNISCHFGTIDSDYRSSVMVKLINLSEPSCFENVISRPRFFIKKGDRIAQAVVVPITRVILVESNELSETERGLKGLGSTGT